jgi:hydroxymethylglutaryl-CoA lyase
LISEVLFLAKAIPQLRDTSGSAGKSRVADPVILKLLAIVANTRGAEEASVHPGIAYLGFPLSISETFQQRNTNKSISEALSALEQIQNVCVRSNKKLVTYISMGFGNPYGDPYEISLVANFVDIIVTIGSEIISLSDTIGVSNPENIRFLFSNLSQQFPKIELGAHLHSTPQTAREKIEAAFQAGCRRFDGAIHGFGGCPMAEDELVGNIATESILTFLEQQGISLSLNKEAFGHALMMADKTFPPSSH